MEIEISDEIEEMLEFSNYYDDKKELEKDLECDDEGNTI
jgi:hypothetical protein